MFLFWFLFFLNTQMPYDECIIIWYLFTFFCQLPSIWKAFWLFLSHIFRRTSILIRFFFFICLTAFTNRTATMNKQSPPIANRISKLCFKKFEDLSKTGKPVVGKEWTVYTCVLQLNECNDELKVVSLSTGNVTVKTVFIF